MRVSLDSKTDFDSIRFETYRAQAENLVRRAYW